MKKFLAIFTGSPAKLEEWMKLSDADRKARETKGMKAWQDWVTKNQKHLRDTGGPLSKTIRVDVTGPKDIRNSMSAYNIVEANSHAEAAQMFLDHPHFSIFPGDGVEIMEIMPIPTMK